MPPPADARGELSLFAAALAVIAVACGGPAFDPGPTVEVERGRIERIVVATGTIEPEREVQVRSRIAGIVEAVHVEDGDVVEEGQPLVEIERDLLASQAREAEAALREARVELRYSKIDLERADELQRGGATSPQKQDAARSRYERALASVARAEARLETLSTELSYATVRSPLSGHVLDVPVEVGSAVAPVTAVTGGEVLVSLAATERLHLEGLVDENEVARVVLGQPARLRTEAFAGRSFQGVVTEIAPLGQRVQNVTYFEVEIEITDPNAQLLLPRMSGDAEIVTEVVEDAVVIPETALRYRGDAIYVDTVLRQSEPRVEPRDVQIGIVDGARVQILEGLEPGEEVVVR